MLAIYPAQYVPEITIVLENSIDLDLRSCLTCFTKHLQIMQLD